MRSIACGLAAMCLTTLVPAPVAGQESQSGHLARELSTLLASRHQGVIAAKDPDDADRFVAAMLSPHVQMLVISARYATPSVLNEKLAKQEDYDVFALLKQTSIQDSRVFFQDLRADGLHAKPRTAADVMYEGVAHRTAFDGNPENGKISKAAYASKFREADALSVGCSPC